MSYYLYDTTGYLAEGPSIEGLRQLAAWAVGTGNLTLQKFFDDGYTDNPVELAEALSIVAPPVVPSIESSRVALATAASSAEDCLILSDGVGNEAVVALANPYHEPAGSEKGGEFARAPSDTQALYSDGKGNYTAERAALHEQIIAKYMANTHPVENPQGTILGGGMASGKTTLVKQEKLIGENIVSVNVDDIRGDLPEFKPSAGKPVSTAFTHEEASDISKVLMKRSIEGKRNIILDGTGNTTLEKLGGKIASMRGNGYRVVGEYVTTSVTEAIARAHERGLKTGRFVPPTAMREAHRAVSRIFPEAIRQNLFDVARLWDTSGPFGSKPKLVMQSRGRRMTIKNHDLWMRFIAKGNE